jgi:hypothetical protein
MQPHKVFSGISGTGCTQEKPHNNLPLSELEPGFSALQRKICDFHDGEDSSQGLQGEGGGSMDLRNVGILPQHFTAPQPTNRLGISEKV